MPELASNNHIVKLSDGRSLGYSEFGDPGGFPVINNHGGLVGRLDVRPADDAARRQGIRLISPDRPGIGLSTHLRGRDTLDWTDDVGELLEALNIDRFAVMGWSMGGQYAAACACRWGKRVTQATLIASAIPMNDYLLGELNTTDKFFTWAVRDYAPLASAGFAALGFIARHMPVFFTWLTARNLSRPDAGVLLREPAEYFARAAAEALCSTEGMAEEYRAWVRPWRFKLENIKSPTHVWEGDHDTLLPTYWARELAGMIPGAKLTMCRNEGHFLAHNHYEQMFKEMAQSAGA